ncbi:hypothetical protein vseg_004898 [Gypsophila vaccaria]
MGIARPSPPPSLTNKTSSIRLLSSSSASVSSICENSMSQEYHPQHPHPHPHPQGNSNIFAFPNNGFDRSEEDPSTTTDDPNVAGLNPAVYESAGMLSEMFNFGSNPGTNPGHIQGVGGISSHEWYGDHHHHQMEGGGINAHNSAAAMQLFLTNAPPRSPSPPAPPPAPPSIGGYHHSMGVVTTSNNNSNNNPNFYHHHHHHMHSNPAGELSGMIEGQGLSLSLSSSLQHLEAAKQAEDNQILFFNQHQHHHQGANTGVGPSSTGTNASSPTHFFKNLTSNAPGPQAHMGYAGPSTSGVGFGSGTASLGVVNVLRNSKYAKPAQELLEEFCSVGRGQLSKAKLGRQNSAASGGGGGAAGTSSSTSKDPHQLSPADRIEHQRRKVKLIAMLDEVDRRYNHYCEQMQMVVNSFDLVMGYGGAIPYTALAQKAMSRHFRCLKDAVHAQLKHSCELLGEKDPTASSGLTKGETPRLKMLEQSLRQQRAFHQMGMMDQEAWRPQRGLPERSVNILRAWLFEHFLHPYPSDADKHLLARQTGLSRNQVSNWFINARVRLWKPMVEEMYQQESKDRDRHHDPDDDDDNQGRDDQDEDVKSENNSNNNNSFSTTQQQQSIGVAQNPMPSSEGQRSADTVNPVPHDSDPSLHATINRHHHHHHHHPLHFQQQQQQQHANVSGLPSSAAGAAVVQLEDFPDDGPDGVGSTTMIRFGSVATAGDVSLTLGLRHAGGNAPEKNSPFSVRDFDGC